MVFPMLNRKNKHIFWVCFACLVLLTSSPASAQIPSNNLQDNSQFQIIEQPLPVKAAVTIGGFSLISLELWWFTYSRK